MVLEKFLFHIFLSNTIVHVALEHFSKVREFKYLNSSSQNSTLVNSETKMNSRILTDGSTTMLITSL